MIKDKFKSIPCSIKALVLYLAINLIIAKVARNLPNERIGLANLAMTTTLVIGIVSIFASSKFMGNYNLLDMKITQSLDWTEWVVIALLSLMLWLFGGLAGDYLAEVLNDQNTLNYQMLFSDASTELVLMAAVFVGPISEEFVFRGMFFTSVRHDLGAKRASVITAVMFVWVHQTLMHVFFTFGLGMLLAYIMQKTNDIYDCIALHMGFNFTSMILSILVELVLVKTNLYQIIKNPFVCIAASVVILVYIYIKFIKDLPGKNIGLSN